MEDFDEPYRCDVGNIQDREEFREHLVGLVTNSDVSAEAMVEELLKAVADLKRGKNA